MTGYVYFAQCGKSIKIGHSLEVGRRIPQIKTGNPDPINLIATISGSMSFEAAIHRHLIDYRISGEWFRDHADVRAVISDLQARGPAAIGFIEPEWSPPPRRSGNVDPSLLLHDLDDDEDFRWLSRWTDLLHEFATLCGEHEQLLKASPEAKELARQTHVNLAILNGVSDWGLGKPEECLALAEEKIHVLSEELKTMARPLDGTVARAARLPAKPKARHP